MKIQLLAIAVLLLGTLTVSGIKEPDEVCIKLNFKQGPWEEPSGDGDNDGRWQATGTFVDGGTVHDAYQMQYDPYPTMVGMNSYYTMTGRKGDLYIEVELVSYDWVNPWKIQFEGSWTIVGGTGAYDGATGGGDATQIIVFAAAVNSAHWIPGVGGPAMSNHVLLEGTFEFLPAS